VLLRRLSPTSSSVSSSCARTCSFVHGQILRRGDVLMAVDGIKLANDGTIPFRKGERVELQNYIAQLYKGDMVKLKILRDGQVCVCVCDM
jgi:hypothetical protein